tara:strand:- start:915 stop:1154 length:240 start_codon:yes stop_codon:yes gene_type:complete
VFPEPTSSIGRQIVTVCHGAGPISTADIARTLGERDEYVDDIAERMESLGYIERAPVPGSFSLGWRTTGEWSPDNEGGL